MQEELRIEEADTRSAGSRSNPQSPRSRLAIPLPITTQATSITGRTDLAQSVTSIAVPTDGITELSRSSSPTIPSENITEWPEMPPDPLSPIIDVSDGDIYTIEKPKNADQTFSISDSQITILVQYFAEQQLKWLENKAKEPVITSMKQQKKLAREFITPSLLELVKMVFESSTSKIRVVLEIKDEKYEFNPGNIIELLNALPCEKEDSNGKRVIFDYTVLFNALCETLNAGQLIEMTAGFIDHEVRNNINTSKTDDYCRDQTALFSRNKNGKDNFGTVFIHCLSKVERNTFPISAYQKAKTPGNNKKKEQHFLDDATQFLQSLAKHEEKKGQFLNSQGKNLKNPDKFIGNLDWKKTPLAIIPTFILCALYDRITRTGMYDQSIEAIPYKIASLYYHFISYALLHAYEKKLRAKKITQEKYQYVQAFVKKLYLPYDENILPANNDPELKRTLLKLWTEACLSISAINFSACQEEARIILNTRKHSRTVPLQSTMQHRKLLLTDLAQTLLQADPEEYEPYSYSTSTYDAKISELTHLSEDSLSPRSTSLSEKSFPSEDAESSASVDSANEVSGNESEGGRHADDFVESDADNAVDTKFIVAGLKEPTASLIDEEEDSHALRPPQSAASSQRVSEEQEEQAYSHRPSDDVSTNTVGSTLSSANNAASSASATNVNQDTNIPSSSESAPSRGVGAPLSSANNAASSAAHLANGNSASVASAAIISNSNDSEKIADIGLWSRCWKWVTTHKWEIFCGVIITIVLAACIAAPIFAFTSIAAGTAIGTTVATVLAFTGKILLASHLANSVASSTIASQVIMTVTPEVLTFVSAGVISTAYLGYRAVSWGWGKLFGNDSTKSKVEPQIAEAVQASVEIDRNLNALPKLEAQSDITLVTNSPSDKTLATSSPTVISANTSTATDQKEISITSVTNGTPQPQSQTWEKDRQEFSWRDTFLSIFCGVGRKHSEKTAKDVNPFKISETVTTNNPIFDPGAEDSSSQQKLLKG